MVKQPSSSMANYPDWTRQW